MGEMSDSSILTLSGIAMSSEQYSTPLSDLPIKTGIVTPLLRYDIETIGQIGDLSTNELSEIPGIGRPELAILDIKIGSYLKNRFRLKDDGFLSIRDGQDLSAGQSAILNIGIDNPQLDGCLTNLERRLLKTSLGIGTLLELSRISRDHLVHEAGFTFEDTIKFEDIIGAYCSQRFVFAASDNERPKVFIGCTPIHTITSQAQNKEVPTTREDIIRISIPQAVVPLKSHSTQDEEQNDNQIPTLSDKYEDAATEIKRVLSETDRFRCRLLSQVFNGVTFSKCSRDTGLPYALLYYVVLSAVREYSTPSADRYLWNIKLYMNAEDFALRTGEPSEVYNYVVLRLAATTSETIERAASKAAIHIVNLTSLVARSLLANGNKPIEEIRDVRNSIASAARTDFPALQIMDATALSEELNKEDDFFVDKKGRVTLLRISPTGIRRLIASADSNANNNTEYSIRYFFTKLGSVRSRLNINSPELLYKVLRQGYGDNSSVSFKDDSMSVVYGQGSAVRQLGSLIEKYAPIKRERLIGLYQSNYGFDNKETEEFLASFSSQFDGYSYHNKRWEAKSTSLEKRISRRRRLTVKERAFFKSELTGQCCDLKLIEARYHSRFPNREGQRLTDELLNELGWKRSGALLFPQGTTIAEYFRSLIYSYDLFARGERLFEDSVFQNSSFRRELGLCLRYLDYFEYEKDRYISLRKLCSSMNVTEKDIRSYANAACDLVPPGEAFTPYSLEKRYRFSHHLESLVDDYGISQYFFEGLLDKSYRTETCSINHQKVFCCGVANFTAADFITQIIQFNGPQELEDIIDILKADYGITSYNLLVIGIIKQSNLYYDNITDCYYLSEEQWREDVHNELAY